MPDTGTTTAWVFGYGSLIWRPGFDYLECQTASLNGYTRRFWQGSHDHRGMPDAPGRVVTLVQRPGARCLGHAYRLKDSVIHEIFDQLDYREKNGYERVRAPLHLTDGRSVEGLVYIATPDNFAFLGDAPAALIAQQIHASHGPSGSNTEYLMQLAAALRKLNADDPHVFDLEQRVQSLITRATTRENNP